ncbi:YchJ family metal-binding protein [Nocardioides sp. AE5]|uniref:YchJ family protein n=1 Tax=Nocardioides sp. AE5 TaxID=2962573 RepID=UPI00288132D6|nr:YchJ family metal-binding protein [Nocardioides sp. AE5]MDT0202271.1 YchJ family metal-binding protein [Nocardioides sp. AE5]
MSASVFGSMTCPCGTGTSYGGCCGRFHRGAALPATAEELMRSRYAAYAVDELDYVFRTWHPRTRPTDPKPQPGTTWVALEILDTVDGSADDETGMVEFRAHFRDASGAGVLHERSTFTRRAGRWFYLSREE